MNELVVVTPIGCPEPGAPTPRRSEHDPSVGREVAAVQPPSLLEAPGPRAVLQVTGPAAAWLESRWIVLGLLALAGPIGLPALWLSRRFSRTTKIAVSVAFVLTMLVLPLVAVWYFCDFRLRPLVDALSAAGRAR